MVFRTNLTTQDHELIKTLALQGEKLDNIAKQLSVKVSRQRIKQLTQKYGIDSFKIRQETLQKEHNAKMFKKWGPDWDKKEFRKSLIYQTMRTKFRQKKANAVREGKTFTIDFGELEFPTHCPVLGIELDYFNDKRAENSVSFDQIIPGKGYISGNVIIMSWRANRIKNDGTLQEHQQIVNFMRNSAV